MNRQIRNITSAGVIDLPVDKRVRMETFLGAKLPSDFKVGNDEEIQLLGHAEMEELMLERRPFFFIEKAVAITDNTGVVRTVFGTAEMSLERVAGHFPTRPIVPLIELCKSIAQTGIILAAFQGDETKAPIAISAGQSKATARDLIDAPARILIKTTLMKSRMRLHFVDGATYLIGSDQSVKEIGRLDDVMYTLISREELLRKS